MDHSDAYVINCIDEMFFINVFGNVVCNMPLTLFQYDQVYIQVIANLDKLKFNVALSLYN